jgi:hypothetical protein
MFVGTEQLRDVANYLHGLEHGINLGKSDPFDQFRLFRRWIEGRFVYCRAAWGWDQLLLHACGTDSAALVALPGLFREFLSDLDSLGASGIEEKVSTAILAKNRAED